MFGVLRVPDFKIYYEDVIIRMVGYWLNDGCTDSWAVTAIQKQTDLCLLMGHQDNSVKKVLSVGQMILEQVHISMGKMMIHCVPHITYKYLLKL